jgi:cyclophilin family peptidyl-prolyl cis-trans isomerase
MRPRVLAALAGLLTLPLGARAENPVVRFATTLGDFDVEVCLEVSPVCLAAAPDTAANFLSNVDDGKYGEGAFVERSVETGMPARPFVIQGGAWRIDENSMLQQISGPTIANEFAGFSNLRGTLSVPLQGSSQCDTDENSGSTSWFVNLGDNSALDCGLFTVFAVVIGNGMAVVDEIAALRVYQAAAVVGLTHTPLLDSFPCDPPIITVQCLQSLPPPTILLDYLVYYTATRVPEPGAAASALAAAGALAWLARRRSRAEIP